METVSEKTGIEEAIARYKGSVGLLAKAIVAPRTTVEYWRKKGVVAPEFCDVVERITLVPAERLNPSVNWPYFRTHRPPSPPAATP